MYRLDNKLKSTKFASLTEVSQTSPLRWFAVVPDGPSKFVRASPTFKCRDYLNDVVFATVLGMPLEKYGYHAEPGTCIARNGDLVLGITASGPDGGVDKYIKNLQRRIKDFLNPLEVAGGLPPTKIHRTRVADCYILRASGRWRESAAAISLYSMYIRMLSLIPYNHPTIREDNYEVLVKYIRDYHNITQEASFLNNTQNTVNWNILEVFCSTIKTHPPTPLPMLEDDFKFSADAGVWAHKISETRTLWASTQAMPLAELHLPELHDFGIQQVVKAPAIMTLGWVNDLVMRRSLHRIRVHSLSTTLRKRPPHPHSHSFIPEMCATGEAA